MKLRKEIAKMTDKTFELLRAACIEVWEEMRRPDIFNADGRLEEHGNEGYIDGKIANCRERKNIDDNYVGLIGGFDRGNTMKLRLKLQSSWSELVLAFEAKGSAL
jgi:hypothetical protein